MKRDTRNLLLVLGALWLWSRSRAASPATTSTPQQAPKDEVDPNDPNQQRVRVVNAALGEIGQRDPLKYWRDVMPGVDDAQLATYAKTRDWCGGFALWAIKKAGLAPDLTWKDGKGFCYNLPTTTSPKPGDIAYFKGLNHHAIVVMYDPATDVLETVDGNQGALSDPAVPTSIRTAVATHTRKGRDATAFYSIEPLLTHEVTGEDVDSGGATVVPIRATPRAAKL